MTQTVLVLDGNGKRGIFTHYLCKHIRTTNLAEPSLIVGVSAGAFVGALIASGKIDDMTEEDIISYGQSIRSTGKRRIPWNSALIPGEHKTKIFCDIFKDMLFGEVNIPLAILVDTVGEKPQIFCSWKPEHSKIELYKILDATTAIPIVFPSVPIGGKHYVDAVLISTKPTNIAYHLGKKLLGSDQFRMISIGNQRPGYSSSKKYTEKGCDGILDHIRHGLFTEMIIRRDHMMDDLLLETMETRFLRIEESVIALETKTSTYKEFHDMCQSKAAIAFEKALIVMCERFWIS